MRKKTPILGSTCLKPKVQRLENFTKRNNSIQLNFARTDGTPNSKMYALKSAEGRFRSFFEPGYDTIVQQIMHTNASSMKNKYGEDFIQS
jgi:hypothetical protein